jgi:hypothetical protein
METGAEGIRVMFWVLSTGRASVDLFPKKPGKPLEIPI